MKLYLRCFICAFGLFGVLGVSQFWKTGSQVITQTNNQSSDISFAEREDAYRANNLGVAYLEQFNHKQGAEAFQRALAIDPKLEIARINLAIALYNIPDIEGALGEAQKASEAAPNRPQPLYILGLIAKTQNRSDEAIAFFKRVLTIDPRDVGTNVNLGQIYMQQRKYAEAIAVFRAALDAEPYNSTAMYNLATALLRDGKREEGQSFMTRFQTLRQSGAATSLGQNYFEQGRYAEAITSTGFEAGLVNAATPNVSFADATASVFNLSTTKTTSKKLEIQTAFGRAFRAGSFTPALRRELVESLGGGKVLFDFDGDGDLDLFTTESTSQKLFRNEKGKFIDVSTQSGAFTKASKDIGLGAIAGDFDNDEKPDLFVLRYGKSSLYHNEGDGRFTDVTTSAKIPSYPYLSISAAFVDVDHDGDLDIFVAGLADLNNLPKKNSALTFPQSFAGAPNMLLRNNGDGTFLDNTEAAKVKNPPGNQATAIVPFDYDNRRDIDLLIVNYSTAPTLFRNMRDGTFRDVAAKVGLNEKASGLAVAAGDVNKDGFTDFFFGNGTFAVSDGKEKYALTTFASVKTKTANGAQFLDYDNDGLLDLIAVSDADIFVYRNLGDKWEDVGKRAVSGNIKSGRIRRGLASGDIDGDGDNDLLLSSAANGLSFLRNEGGNLNHSIRVNLAGKVSNRSAIGAKIEARAGSLIQKLETYSAAPAPAPSDIIFGLGQRASTDAVRVLWTAGIVQAEIEANPINKISKSITITEIDRKPSSCPFLYTWNGKEFEFVTDFMGGGEMGSWVAPGVRNMPDSDEYVRIRGEQLKERDGRFEIRVTNELEEALFLDHLKLIAISHPENTEVYPNEGLGNPTASAFKLYAAQNAQPPDSATDDSGRNVLPQIEKIDRQYADGFPLHKIRGYAEKHSLTLNLGKPAKGRTLLLLNGWTDYAFSSDNVAASQSGLSMMPPALQVKDARGRWKTVIEQIGFPVGRPQTVTVDLTGKFLSASREVRIVTNMRIYWDQILVDTSGGAFETKTENLEPLTADLRWRGFSAETTPDGREPFGYDYSRVSFNSPWKLMPGRYTREGDVRELIQNIDDMFVISRTGDEISISFDAGKVAPLENGWKRTFLLYADGFSKEMDINSASPDQLLPLPFHGMKEYPYKTPEIYPLNDERRAYIERYNTRIVGLPVLPVEAMINRLNIGDK